MNQHALDICSQAARRLLAIALCTSAAAASAQHYSFNVLPTGDDVFVRGLGDTGSAINNAGHAVGTVSGTHDRWGQLWTSPTTAVTQPTSFCCTHTETWAHDLNNADWVVGQDTYQAAIWINNQPHLLPALAGAGASVALGINDAGQVVGRSNTSYGIRATLWDNGRAIDLGTLGGTTSYAFDINSSGIIVGSSQTAANAELYATLWHNGAITNLGVGEATAVNDAGQVVGTLGGRTALWDNGALTYLDSFLSHANDINNRGQVVGRVERPGDFPNELDTVYRATLWDGKRSIDLNSFLSQSERDAGWVLEEAVAINDLGWITGSAHNSQYFMDAAYLLVVTPVPEAATLTLWLAELGVLGIASRRMRARRIA